MEDECVHEDSELRERTPEAKCGLTHRSLKVAMRRTWTPTATWMHHGARAANVNNSARVNFEARAMMR